MARGLITRRRTAFPFHARNRATVAEMVRKLRRADKRKVVTAPGRGRARLIPGHPGMAARAATIPVMSAGPGGRRRFGFRVKLQPRSLVPPIAALLVAAGLACGAGARAADDTEAVLRALNRARTDPAGFAVVLQHHRARLQGRHYLAPGTANTWIATQEGVAAVDEAIAVLRGTPPLPPLVPLEGLRQAAADQVAWQGPRGELGHGGAGGSSPSERMRRHGVTARATGENISYGSAGLQIVIDLIVDDGVASRGHRRNILDPGFRAVGIAIGPHRRYGTMCVMDLAAAP
jgi:uncharacterized protein YkwD